MTVLTFIKYGYVDDKEGGGEGEGVQPVDIKRGIGEYVNGP